MKWVVKNGEAFDVLYNRQSIVQWIEEKEYYDGF